MTIGSGTKGSLGTNASDIRINYSTSDTAMVLYRDNTAVNLTGRRLHYTTGLGTAFTLSVSPLEPDMALVEDSKHIVTFADGADGDNLKAAILTPSGFSSVTTIDSAGTCRYTTVAAASTSEAVIAYRRGSVMYMAELDVSGAAPSLVGSPVSTGLGRFPEALENLETGRYLLAYSNHFSLTYYAVISVSGGLALGTAVSHSRASVTDPPPHGLSLYASDKVFAAVTNRCVVVRTSTDPPTFGAEYTASDQVYSAYAIDTDTVLILRDAGASNYFYVESLAIDGSDNIAANGDGADVIDRTLTEKGGGAILTDTVNGTGLVIARSSDDSDGWYNTLSSLPTPPPPPPVLRFYQDTDALTERGTLNITDIRRGAMLVRSDGTVLVGSGNAADSVVCEFGTAADNYATWTDITDNLGPGPVTSIREI